MFRFLPALLATATFVAPAQAETPMTAAEFDAYVTGKTLTYSAGGEPYGIEQYLPGRQVMWAFVGDACMRGSWYARGEHICFEYGGAVGEQCWIFTKGESGLTGVFMGDGAGTTLVEVEKSPQPMSCFEPLLGV